MCYVCLLLACFTSAKCWVFSTCWSSMVCVSVCEYRYWAYNRYWAYCMFLRHGKSLKTVLKCLWEPCFPKGSFPNRWNQWEVTYTRCACMWQYDVQLDEQSQEIQSRDRKLSQSTHQMALKRVELSQMTANVTQLQSKLDACRQHYNSSAQRCKDLESEMARLCEQLSSSRQQVTILFNLQKFTLVWWDH